MSSFVIRKAQPGDAKELSILWEQHVFNNSKLAPKHYRIVRNCKELSRRKVSNLLLSKKGFFLVAFDKKSKKVAGFLYSKIKKNKPFYRLSKIGVLDTLFVSSAYRKQGVATALKSNAF